MTRGRMTWTMPYYLNDDDGKHDHQRDDDDTGVDDLDNVNDDDRKHDHQRDNDDKRANDLDDALLP